ncbi:stomatin family protein, partial [Kipferlia bialata]|eukprot:g10714.t1
MGAGQIAGVLIAAFAVLIVFILAKYRPIVVVKEKQAIIIERLGKYTNTLTAGIHFVMPIISQPRKYSYHYFDTDPRTQRVKLVRKRNIMIISTSDEIQDYPATHIISRDNASCYLDCCLSYSIQNPRQMIYSCQNLPLMLQKCLQSHVRNVAGQLDIDQLIEESGSLKILTSLLQNEATRWGVRIRFVKVQNLKAQELEQDLARKKNAELQN